jgi:hypothetical protein
MPWFALQYRLSEVGQPHTDPRLLLTTARELALRPKQLDPADYPREPLPGVFVSPNTVDAEVDSLTSRVIDQLEAINAETIVSVSLEALLPSTVTVQHVEENVELLGEPPGYQRIVLTTTADFLSGNEVWSLWFSHDAKWIYPDDPRLFAHLAYCAERNLRPIVVARKIAPPTFVLFKAIGIIGLQYYAYIVRDGAIDRLRVAIDDLGWTNTISAQALQRHAFRGRIDGALEMLPSGWQRASRILRACPPKKLLAARDNDPRALLEWLASPEMTLVIPTRWKQTVSRWSALEKSRRRRKPTLEQSSSHEQAAQASSTSKEARPSDNGGAAPTIFGRGTEKSRIPIRNR